MQKRLLLLKLRLCDGIGIRGENLVYRWLLEHPRVQTLSVNTIAKIARVRPNLERRFKEHFQSQQLLDEIRYNVERVNWISILDEEYPLLLREANLPPNILFYLGDWRLTQRRLLAVVGARQNSYYASGVLKGILPPVINRGIHVVSGLASGVDQISHETTINYGGRTIAVIGTGLDVYYPQSNRHLQKTIAQRQLLISEYPLGIGVQKYHFPDRNRIIAGLVEKVLVVEAKKRSGSLITANLALNNNRDVLAIPGPINSPLSVGCNDLIIEGAVPITCAQDLLDQFFNLTI